MSDTATGAAAVATKHAPKDAPTPQETSNKPTLIIDKISLTIDITNPDHQKYVLGSLMDMSKPADHPFHQCGWASAVNGGYKAAPRVHFPHPTPFGVNAPWTKRYALVQAGPKNAKGGHVRLEWNPAGLTAAQSHHLFKQLEVFLSIEATHLLHGKVTRLDIAVDIPGMRPGDYIWERPKSPLRRPVYKKGALETLYLGSTFKGQITIYDKAVQQGNAGAKLTRIEARMRPNHQVYELHALKNPFASLKAYALMKAALILSVPHRQALHRAARAEGLDSAFADFPVAVRGTYLSAVKASGAAFWKPVAYWVTWPGALKKAFPIMLESSVKK